MAEDVRARGEVRQDLAGLVSRYRRHLPIIALAAVVMMILFGAITAIMPKRYTATSELTYAPKASVVKASSGASDLALSDAARDAAVDANVQAVRSLPVALRVADDQHLDRDPALRTLASKYGDAATGREAIAAAALEEVRVRRVGTTALIDISYTSKDPLRAADIANSFAKAYLDIQLQQMVGDSQRSSQRLDRRVAMLANQVEEADAAVARFKQQNNLLTDPGSTMNETEISTINTELADARAQQAETAARAAAAQRAEIGGLQSGDFGDALASQTISELRRQQAEVARKVAELGSRYGPKHPLRVDAQKELGEINAQVQSELDRLATNTRAQSHVIDQRVGSLQSSLAAAQGRMSGNVASSVELAALQRKADTARSLYNGLLASSGQETANRDLVQPDTRLTTPATPPLAPSSPNLPLNLLVGLVLGLAIGLAIAYVRERWSVGLNTIDDVERLLNQNYLNSIPTLQSAIDAPKTTDPVAAVTAHPLSLYSEAFRSLAASLLFAERGSTTKVIGVTSALPKEGKSTTSSAMARVLAMAGSKVMLVDADLRRRSITQTLSPDADTGLIEVLNGTATLAEAIFRDESGADVLPLAPNSHRGPQPFDSPAFDQLMAHLRETYDVIILDTAPVLAVVDTRILLHHLDALALLARWRVTPVKAIRAAIHQVESVGGTITGVAMTLVNLKTQSKSGYGDASYYYQEMKDYYVSAE